MNLLIHCLGLALIISRDLSRDGSSALRRGLSLGIEATDLPPICRTPRASSLLLNASTTHQAVQAPRPCQLVMNSHHHYVSFNASVSDFTTLCRVHLILRSLAEMPPIIPGIPLDLNRTISLVYRDPMRSGNRSLRHISKR